jgi:Reverse transcriptase (RNA-dependent DNA polymerase)
MIRIYLDRIVITYLDDILIYSENKEEYEKYINEILNYLLRFDLKLKSEKYEFYRIIVTFLGFIISTEGIRIDNEKIKVV